MGFNLDNTFAGVTWYPVQTPTGAISIWGHSGIGCEEASQYFFKKESANLQGVTVRSVAVRYVNIGIVTVTMTISGSGGTRTSTLVLGKPDPTGTGDPNKNMAYYGNTPPAAVNDGLFYVAYFNFEPLTTEDFQIRLDIAANAGPFKLVRLYVLGEGEEISR